MSRPRIRSLKPEALQHPKVGGLSDMAFRLWVGLITQADDEGRLRWHADQFSRILVFGYHEKVTAAMVSKTLLEIVAAGLAYHFVVDAKEYVELHDWKEHQRVDRPVLSVLPARPLDSSRALASPRADRDLDRIGSEVEPVLSPPSEASEVRSALLLKEAEAVEAVAGSARQAGSAATGGGYPVKEPAEFTAFYEAYPKKKARVESLRAWLKLKPDDALVAQIMAAIEAQKAPAPAPGNTLAPVNGQGYIPYPASWINGKRWTDEIISAAPAEGSTPSPARHLLAEFGRLYEAKVTYPYVANDTRDLGILEDLMSRKNGHGEIGFPPATLQRLMRGFFKYPPQWARDKDRFDIPMFKASFPELTRMLSKGDI